MHVELNKPLEIAKELTWTTLPEAPLLRSMEGAFCCIYFPRKQGHMHGSNCTHNYKVMDRFAHTHTHTHTHTHIHIHTPCT